MASGATVTDTIVIDAPGTGGTITNVALVSTPSYDPFPANNTASQDTTVLADAENVYLAKTGQGPVTMRMVVLSPALAQARWRH